MSGEGLSWRADIDALVFQPAGHGGWCAIHRLAFRALLGTREPGVADCLAYATAHRAAFEAAAAGKIARRGCAAAASLHLTSRDVARLL
ncbi:hypothetical protein TSH100_29830 [Azospirillum sp. TSH100]|uniref:hypothetical protein n=1 Tax=Azospirillum sp. TSH100 TaxID=652764 RepID=UPI000D60EB62|nr:hypothetical protein [Azospirillum sp. TSH100]PWC80302.1 hypothetical protein TSH100_29830 [Azospirillum sp. TSH100]QCG91950.1 hypothetical protein E6C72_29685 [Azospirillum sp. TSH100]